MSQTTTDKVAPLVGPQATRPVRQARRPTSRRAAAQDDNDKAVRPLKEATNKARTRPKKTKPVRERDPELRTRKDGQVLVVQKPAPIVIPAAAMKTIDVASGNAPTFAAIAAKPKPLLVAPLPNKAKAAVSGPRTEKPKPLAVASVKKQQPLVAPLAKKADGAPLVKPLAKKDAPLVAPLAEKANAGPLVKPLVKKDALLVKPLAEKANAGPLVKPLVKKADGAPLAKPLAEPLVKPLTKAPLVAAPIKPVAAVPVPLAVRTTTKAPLVAPVVPIKPATNNNKVGIPKDVLLLIQLQHLAIAIDVQSFHPLLVALKGAWNGDQTTLASHIAAYKTAIKERALQDFNGLNALTFMVCKSVLAKEGADFETGSKDMLTQALDLALARLSRDLFWMNDAEIAQLVKANGKGKL
ncbi:hypothetical protein ml_140 [Mollivirus sibericum]|uniref:hypothetical protein n=1 Tax=Mollivirus sibericum TaxID=1678078 RepID=UPI0006B2EC6C|nr:hypothetical protein ml_140 [Mollivirus sibericum]ALD61942.1 hypothetical protein ml_140 [Mollivirus sibericum]